MSVEAPQIPIEDSQSRVTIRATVEAELARRAEIEKVATALLDEANHLQDKAKNLRTQAHRLRLLIKDDAGRE
jgi:hypothetical protein